MNTSDFFRHYEFQANIGGEANIIQRIAAQVIDMTDRAIVQECIKTASAAGITDLYLLDKQFVHEALSEKLDRMKTEPLTFEELQQMEGEPVWVEHWHGGEWVIVHWDYVRRIASTCKACLHEHEYGKTWLAYRRKVEEGATC